MNETNLHLETVANSGWVSQTNRHWRRTTGQRGSRIKETLEFWVLGKFIIFIDRKRKNRKKIEKEKLFFFLFRDREREKNTPKDNPDLLSSLDIFCISMWLGKFINPNPNIYKVNGKIINIEMKGLIANSLIIETFFFHFCSHKKAGNTNELSLLNQLWLWLSQIRSTRDKKGLKILETSKLIHLSNLKTSKNFQDLFIPASRIKWSWK